MFNLPYFNFLFIFFSWKSTNLQDFLNDVVIIGVFDHIVYISSAFLIYSVLNLHCSCLIIMLFAFGNRKLINLIGFRPKNLLYFFLIVKKRFTFLHIFSQIAYLSHNFLWDTSGDPLQ